MMSYSSIHAQRHQKQLSDMHLGLHTTISRGSALPLVVECDERRRRMIASESQKSSVLNARKASWLVLSSAVALLSSAMCVPGTYAFSNSPALLTLHHRHSASSISHNIFWENIIIRSTRESTVLGVVRKRKGDFSNPNNAKVRLDGKISRNALTKSELLEEVNTFRPKSISNNHGRPNRNVFETFTPQYEMNDIDVINNRLNKSDDVPKSNAEATKNGSFVTNKIEELLSDDDGEEDVETPDFSEEAANQLADKAAYSRISEEAKSKANAAVQKKKQEAKSSSSIRVVTEGNRKSKVRASVKETGVDTMSQYVKSMGQHELLPKNSEILLGRQIQILVKWEHTRQELEEKLLRAPTFAQWADALSITVPELKKQIRRSQRAKAALIEANLRLVVTVARQTVKKGRSEINFQDACQEGIIGLTRACEKFDPERGVRFSTYAVWWIKREVHKSVSDQSRTVRLPANAMMKINEIRINERLLMNNLGRKPTDDEVAEKCNLTLEQMTFYKKAAMDATSLDKQLNAKVGKGSNASGDESNGKTIESLIKDSNPTPAEVANKEMLKDDVRRLIRTLSPREQAVVRLRFGLDDGTPRTLDFIGKKFSVGKEQIRKIEAKALLKLRQPYRNQSVQCYVTDL